MKLAILTSHAIQYQTPLFKKLAAEKDVDLTVYFCWTFGREKTFDPEFRREIHWDIDLLQGFSYTYLRNFSFVPSSGFWGQLNFGIIAELARNDYDALLVYGWNSFANWLAFLTAFARRVPVLLHGENPLQQEYMKSPLKLRAKRFLLGWLFRRASAILYIGKENRKFYEYYGVPPRKLFFVPYAVDNERLLGESKRLQKRRREEKRALGIGESDCTILFVGKLIPKKRPMDLLRAYAMVQSKAKRLIFVGDGELRPELEGYVKEHNISGVRFAGFRNQTELPRYYAASDIFVLPSGTGETWGLVVNEAMCFGLPVVVSDVIGCGPDLVREGENGFVFRAGDVERLASFLNLLARSRAMRATFGKRSSEIIQEYSHEKDVKSVMDALRSL